MNRMIFRLGLLCGLCATTLPSSVGYASLVCNGSLSTCSSSSAAALAVYNTHNPGVAVSCSSASNGIIGSSTGTNGITASTSANWKVGAWGDNSGSGGTGVYGINTATNCQMSGAAVLGDALDDSLSWAGYFTGDVFATGTVEAGSKFFFIDHPLEPERKNLTHALVESSERENIYDGIVVLGAEGRAVVQMPEWFHSVNSQFRYHLTPIGQFAPVHVSRRLENGQFEIAGGKQGQRISWQITAVRSDPWAKANPFRPEVDKPPHELGTYVHPRERGLSESLGRRKFLPIPPSVGGQTAEAGVTK